MGATYSLNLRDSPVLQRPVRANDPLVINPLLNEDRLILRDIAPELSTLLPFPFGRLNAPPAQLHSTTTVRCVVNLHKDSLQLLHEKISKDEPNTSPNVDTPNEEQNNTSENENTSLTNSSNGISTNEKIVNTPNPSDFLHTLRFNFDSTEPCQIRVYLLASETTNDASIPPTLSSKAEFGPASFPAGLEQTFSLPLVGPLSLAAYKASELSNTLSGGAIPILISIKSVLESDKKIEENITTKDKDSKDSKDNKDKDKDKVANPNINRVVRHQLTYATLIFCSDGTYAIKVFRQKVHFGGSVFGVHDIFGIDNNEGGENRECVVCLTEPRDTIVLPCRHCCLCGACAEMMRFQTNKCAICRSAVKSFLKVSLSSKLDDSNTPTDNSQTKTSTNNFITQPPIPTPSSLNYNSHSSEESTPREDESVDESSPKLNKVTSGYSKLDQLDEEDEEEELILNKKEKVRKN